MTLTLRNKLRVAPIVEGMVHALVDEALVERNTRNGKGGEDKVRAARYRYQAACDVWSLAFRHLTGAPDAVAPMRALRAIMDDVDPDRRGSNVDDVVSAFLDSWPIGEMKYDEERMKRIMVTELIRAHLSAWSYEPERKGDDDDEASTSGQGINIYKTRQRTANEEHYTGYVDSWAAVLGTVLHKDAKTVRDNCHKAILSVGAGSQTWWTDALAAFERHMAGMV